MSDAAKMDTAEMRYLLGALSEDEKTRMEEAFFADDSKFEAIELAEDELVDAYVRNELSSEEQRKFKAKIQTSPRLWQRVNFARILAEKANALASTQGASSIQAPSTSSRVGKSKIRWWGVFTQRPAWGMVLAACGLFILVASVVLVSGWLRLRNESERLAAERAAYQRQREELDKLSGEQRAKNEQLSAELQRANDQRAKDLKAIEELQQALKLKEAGTQQSFLGTIATAILTPGSLRSGGSGQSELTIGPGTTTARVQLALEKSDYPAYHASIKSADGLMVLRRRGLRPHKTRSGPQLLLSLPAQRLTPGDYIVHIDGVTTSGQIESVDDYALRVKKK